MNGAPIQGLPARFGAPLGVGLVGITLFVVGQERWPDLLVDFGRELYVAWRLSVGDVLYRDVAYFNGPLSASVNALWFRALGPGIQNLAILNLALAAILCVVVFCLLRQVSDRTACWMAVLAFVSLFAFAHLTTIGNYNYVAPYSHELTHGALLSLAGLLFMTSFVRGQRLIFIGGAGLTLGLAFLTKAEVFLAGAAAMAVALPAALWVQRAGGRRAAQIGALFAVCCAAPVLSAFLLLNMALPTEQAARGLLGTWDYLSRADVASLPFYQSGIGTLDAGLSLRLLLSWTGGYALFFGSLATVSLRPALSPVQRQVLVGGYSALGAALLIGLGEAVSIDSARPLPLMMLALGGGCLLVLVQQPRGSAASARVAQVLPLVVFGVVLLGKMVLFARVWHYGFVLAMPATLLAVVTVTGWLPETIARRGGDGSLFRQVAVTVCLLFFTLHAVISLTTLRAKIYPVGADRDRILADWRGPAAARALDDIEQRVAAEETLVVLPEGVMLNYLSRRQSSIPYLNFMPPEVLLFGEERILAALRARPPDYIALVHKDTREYGYSGFGADYALEIYAWVRRNYRDVESGSIPRMPTDSGAIRILKRLPRVEG